MLSSCFAYADRWIDMPCIRGRNSPKIVCNRLVIKTSTSKYKPLQSHTEAHRIVASRASVILLHSRKLGRLANFCKEQTCACWCRCPKPHEPAYQLWLFSSCRGKPSSCVVLRHIVLGIMCRASFLPQQAHGTLLLAESVIVGSYTFTKRWAKFPIDK